MHIVKGTTDGYLRFVSPDHTYDFRCISVIWQEQFKRSAGGAAAGAIIGGLLTGGLGAIAGAAIGGRRKDNSIAVLTIVDDNQNEYYLYVRCNGEQYGKLTTMIYE